MAARNYTLILTDTGDQGTGPYTATAQLNPTTAASGGTAINITFNPGAYTLKDIANRYLERFTDLNANIWNLDPEN